MALGNDLGREKSSVWNIPAIFVKFKEKNYLPPEHINTVGQEFRDKVGRVGILWCLHLCIR